MAAYVKLFTLRRVFRSAAGKSAGTNRQEAIGP
jgi:hypothetical protein